MVAPTTSKEIPCLNEFLSHFPPKIINSTKRRVKKRQKLLYSKQEVRKMNAKKVGSFIKEQRQELGLSQKELAEKLYITDKAVSKWETGVSQTKRY